MLNNCYDLYVTQNALKELANGNPLNTSKHCGASMSVLSSAHFKTVLKAVWMIPTADL